MKMEVRRRRGEKRRSWMEGGEEEGEWDEVEGRGKRLREEGRGR